MQMKLCLLTLCGVLFALPAFAANYEVIDPGDIYYINRFGKNNDTVMVERKLGDNMLKVRNINTGATSVESAGKLLSAQQLKEEERSNKVMGWGAAGAIGYCLLGGCK